MSQADIVPWTNAMFEVCKMNTAASAHDGLFSFSKNASLPNTTFEVFEMGVAASESYVNIEHIHAFGTCFYWTC